MRFRSEGEVDGMACEIACWYKGTGGRGALCGRLGWSLGICGGGSRAGAAAGVEGTGSGTGVCGTSEPGADFSTSANSQSTKLGSVGRQTCRERKMKELLTKI